MANPYKSENPGISLRGFMVSDSKGVLVSSLNELEQHFGLIDPRDAAKMGTRVIERKKAKGTPNEAKEARFAELRAQVQRVFNKERQSRVADYAAYIKRVELEGAYGGAPTPTLALLPPDDGKLAYDKNAGRITVPFGTRALMVDGETQMAARHTLRDAGIISGDEFVAFTFYVSEDLQLFKSIFHDYNLLVHPVKESLTFKLNQDSPITQAAQRACDALHKEFPDSINWNGTSMTKAKYGTTRMHLIAFTLGFAEGIKGLSLNEAKVKRVSRGIVAVDVDALTAHFQSMMSLDRTSYPPPVICQLAGVALHANGHLPFGSAMRLAVDAYDSAKLKTGKPSDWKRIAAAEVIAKAQTPGRRAA